jgi:hypothetical protein
LSYIYPFDIYIYIYSLKFTYISLRSHSHPPVSPKKSALKLRTLFSAGFHEIVPAERLSLLTFQDLRMAILGELRVDAFQWQQEAQYESPYSKVRGCSLGMVLLAPAMAVCALLCACEDFNLDIACSIRR